MGWAVRFIALVFCVFVFACFVVVSHVFERFRLVEVVLMVCFDRVVLFCV